MTRRGWLTLLLGAATYVVAWLFGVKALYPVATGLALAPIAALAWVWLAAGPMQLRRRAGKGVLLEGGDVWVSLDVLPESRLPQPGRPGPLADLVRASGPVGATVMTRDAYPVAAYAGRAP